MHNRDFDFRPTIDNKTKEEWEKELDIDGLIVRFKELGWEVMNWSYDNVNNKRHFVECTGPYYSDFLRGDSEVSLKEAFEKVLNKMQKFNQCENTNGGHEYTNRPGYNNGLLACKKCGFGGYTNLVKIKNRELDHYKSIYEHTCERLSAIQISLNELNVGVNMFGGLIINDEYTPKDELKDYVIVKREN